MPSSGRRRAALTFILIFAATWSCEKSGRAPSPAPDSTIQWRADSAAALEGALSPAGAAAWIDSYYRAIHERRYRDAYAHWEQDGASSGMTYEEFRKGFAETARVEAEVGPPGPMGAAAGSRYVEVPVRLTALMKDGSRERYSGSYTLRCSVVDGATAEQRAWRIYSAHMKRVR